MQVVSTFKVFSYHVSCLLNGYAVQPAVPAEDQLQFVIACLYLESSDTLKFLASPGDSFGIRILSLFLFGVPREQAMIIREIYNRSRKGDSDATIRDPRWRAFIDQMQRDWNNQTLFVSFLKSHRTADLETLKSTVMLAVDVSWLAVPEMTDATVAQSLTYMAIICALGSLVASLLLGQQTRGQGRDALDGVVCSSKVDFSSSEATRIHRPLCCLK